MSPASETVTFIVNWLSLGSLYALMALGLVIVYGILRLVNFAYGELIMVAGYTLYLLGGGPLPWLVMAAVAVAAAVVTSYLTERVAFRPVREKSLTAMLITSFAVSTLLQNAALLFVSPRARVVPLPDLFSDSICDRWDARAGTRRARHRRQPRDAGPVQLRPAQDDPWHRAPRRCRQVHHDADAGRSGESDH